ncbi:RNA polymerase sigma factor [Flavobacterium sp. RHBU_24]|uniref:RNA polymerase sigma factor n=1 Tax=Flavobacterium sp. RHBU_24 TaxID=3391185 RepID=UPI0039853D36
MTEAQLVSGCLQHDRKTQHQVYTTFGGKVLGVCKRYMKDHERAEEMAMNAFLAVFQKIGQYKNEGSFEGWILRIAVNCCLMELRKKTNFTNEVPAESVTIQDDASAEILLLEGDIEQMLKILPDGARVIFNLYAIEGYKHTEIAEQLGISEGTSKSQLNYAREKLKKTFFNTTQQNLR